MSRRTSLSPYRVGADRGAVAKAASGLQKWSNYLYPDRLRKYWFGFNFNFDTGSLDLAGAQTEMSDAEMADLRASGIDHIRLGWYFEEAATSRTDPTLKAACIAWLQYVVPRFWAYGINVEIMPNSTGTARQDIHGQNGGSGTLTQAGWIQYIKNIAAIVLALPGCTGDNFIISLGNEMGLNVNDPYRSMTWYNAFIVAAVPAVRAIAPNTTIVYDLYPTGAPDQYRFGGVTLVPPADQNTLVGLHWYWPNFFSEDQGNADKTPTGMYYVFGIQWGWDRATIQAWLNTWTCGGLYGTGTADGIAATAQINWWRANLNSVCDSDGCTNASLTTRIAGLLSWANDNRVGIKNGEFGMGAALSPRFVMADADQSGFVAGVVNLLKSHDMGNCFWQYKNLTTGVSGSRVLSPTKLAWNTGKTAPIPQEPGPS